MKKYDLIVLGGGPGGYTAAIRAARMGASVVLAEKDLLGGTCTNRGCIPTKALAASAHLLTRLQTAEEMGISTGTGYFLKYENVLKRKEQIVGTLRGGIEKLLEANRVEVVRGRGILAGDDRVMIEAPASLDLRGKAILLATGSIPGQLAVLPLQAGRVVTSDELLQLEKLPKRLVIIGGGVIGCEFASIYRDFGVEVTVIELLDRLLPTLDKSLSSVMARSFKKKGIQVLTGIAAEGVDAGGTEVVVKLPGGKNVSCDLVLVAVGRKAATEGMGFKETGITREKGCVVTDDHMQTSVKGVYAIGDAVGKTWLAHTAMAEAEVAAACALGQERRMRYDAVPSVVYTDPELACVGLLPGEAKERGIEIDKGRFYYGALGKALCDGTTDGHLEIIAEKGGGKVLGGWVAGEHAGTLISEITLAVGQGMMVADFAESIRAHPTLPEMITEATLDSRGLAIHKAPAKRK
ncbi:dihydrolipoyl dehydrogenase [Myxococcota bacterium]